MAKTKVKSKPANGTVDEAAETATPEVAKAPKMTAEERKQKQQDYQRKRWEERDEKQKEYDRAYRRDRARRINEENKQNAILVAAYKAEYGEMDLEKAKELHDKAVADQKAAEHAAKEAERKAKEKVAPSEDTAEN